jgi:hypothetical protein
MFNKVGFVRVKVGICYECCGACRIIETVSVKIPFAVGLALDPKKINVLSLVTEAAIQYDLIRETSYFEVDAPVEPF